MPLTDNILEVYEDALELASKYEVNFVALGRCLLFLLEHSPNLFKGVCVEGDIGPRKAYYLASLARRVHKLGIPEARLIDIGWSKAEVISNKLTKSNWKAWFALAEQHSVHDLKIIMRGEKPTPGTRCVLLYFKPDQYERFSAAVVANGGASTGVGLSDMETAVMAILEKVEGK